MLGAFVPVALKNAAAHDEGAATAVKTAQADCRGGDDAGALPGAVGRQRHRSCAHASCAGRVRPSDGLSKDEWRIFARGADRIAQRGFRRDGAAHGVSSPLRRLRGDAGRDCDAARPDESGAAGTGVRHRSLHATGRAARMSTWWRRSNRFKDRIWYIHLKDLEPNVARQQPRRGVGLLYGDAQRPVSGVGQGVRGFPCPSALARQRAITRDTCWWSRTFCPAWEHRKRARRGTGSIFGRLKRILR